VTSFLSEDLVSGPQRRVFFLGTSFQVRRSLRFVSRSEPSIENFDSGVLSKILVTSVQVIEGFEDLAHFKTSSCFCRHRQTDRHHVCFYIGYRI